MSVYPTLPNENVLGDNQFSTKQESKSPLELRQVCSWFMRMIQSSPAGFEHANEVSRTCGLRNYINIIGCFWTIHLSGWIFVDFGDGLIYRWSTWCFTYSTRWFSQTWHTGIFWCWVDLKWRIDSGPWTFSSSKALQYSTVNGRTKAWMRWTHHERHVSHSP